MDLDEPDQLARDLGGERRCHQLGRLVRRSRRAPRGRVLGERLRRAHLRRRVGQPLGVYLVLVDTLATARQPSADLQRGVDHGAQRGHDDGGLVRHAGI
jgi:hypothetical protein